MIITGVIFSLLFSLKFEFAKIWLQVTLERAQSRNSVVHRNGIVAPKQHIQPRAVSETHNKNPGETGLGSLAQLGS